jgi:hypothetical protein
MVEWIRRLLRRTKFDGGTRCNFCGMLYVGLALDCACTSWGRFPLPSEKTLRSAEHYGSGKDQKIERVT